VFLNIGLSLVTILVVFAGAEIAVRIFFPVENLGNVMQFDPELGWSLVPGSSYHTLDRSRGLDYQIDVNSLGMREREFDPRSRPGTRRLLFLGDSFGFGTGVEMPWRFTDRVARCLDEDVEVINASVPGWGTDQELIYYETRGAQLRPDIVIVTFYMPNDVLNNSLDHLYLGTAPKPRFVLTDDSLEMRLPPRPRIETKFRMRNVLRKSHFLVRVKRRIDQLNEPAAEQNYESLPEGFASSGVGPRSHWSVFQKEPDENLEAAWQTTEAILTRFSRRCRAEGAELVVFAFPSVEADDQWRSWLLEASGMDADALDFDQPFRRMEQFCSQSGIEFLHPVDTFREASTRRELFLEQDGHPSVDGHAVAAQVLLEWLRDRHHMQYTLERM